MKCTVFTRHFLLCLQEWSKPLPLDPVKTHSLEKIEKCIIRGISLKLHYNHWPSERKLRDAFGLVIESVPFLSCSPELLTSTHFRTTFLPMTFSVGAYIRFAQFKVLLLATAVYVQASTSTLYCMLCGIS